MDRTSRYNFWHNVKWFLAMACFSAMVNIFVGIAIGSVAGGVLSGLSMFTMPVLGIATCFAHVVQGPLPSASSSQHTP